MKAKKTPKAYSKGDRHENNKSMASNLIAMASNLRANPADLCLLRCLLSLCHHCTNLPQIRSGPIRSVSAYRSVTSLASCLSFFSWFLAFRMRKRLGRKVESVGRPFCLSLTHKV